MSRHRNVRNYSYEEDMSEDVYGHSVDELDMCISPSTAQQFMYNRGNDNQQSNLFGNYMSGRFGSVEEEQEEEQSEEEDHLANSQDYRRPQLDPVSEAKLSSCLDQLQSVLGDDCHEPTAVDAILKCNFDAERALDYIFSKESTRGSSQKKTAKKQDSNLYGRLLKKNLTTKPLKNQNIEGDPGLEKHAQPPKEANSKNIENNNSVSNTDSLLSMPLRSIIMENQKKGSSEVTATVEYNNQLHLTPLGSLVDRSQQESSSPLIGGLGTSLSSFSQSPLLSVSLETLSREQTTKAKSVQESFLSSLASECNSSYDIGGSLDSHPTLSGLCKMSSSSGKLEDRLTLTSLSSLVSKHDDCAKTNSDLMPLSLANLSKMKQLSDTPEDTLILTSLSSLVSKQHDESANAKPRVLPGISLQKLGNKVATSDTEMSQSSVIPEGMLTNTSLSSLTKQYDKSKQGKLTGLPGISLQELSSQMGSTMKMNLSSNKPEDMLPSTSLSSLAKRHDESNQGKLTGLSGVSLLELATQMPSSLTDMSNLSNKSAEVLMSTPLCSLAQQHDEPNRAKPNSVAGSSLQELANKMPSLTGQVSERDMLFKTSLFSLASLSLDPECSGQSRKGQSMSGISHRLSGNKDSALSTSEVPPFGANWRTSSALQPGNHQPDLSQKKHDKKLKNTQAEHKLTKVNQKSVMKKKRSHKISQRSLLLMHPTMFAVTLSYTSKRRHSFPEHLRSKRLCTSGISGYYGNSDVVPFDFSSPSPDDVIKMKQRQRFGIKQEN